MTSQEEPPEKKKMRKMKKTGPPSFLSLPDELVLNCLAHISKSYYPKLSVVSKSFCYILSSKDLSQTRIHLKTRENCVYVCLQSLTDHNQSWFSLWIKPDPIKKTSTKALLVPTHSSYISPTLQVGSKIYGIGNQNVPSSVVRVRNKLNYDWSEAPNMKVARKNALTCVIDEKIYVMGGCGAEESVNWAEVFDTKTQTWESLPDPGLEFRSSLIRKILVLSGNLCFKIETKIHVYKPREGKWCIREAGYLESFFMVTTNKGFVVSKKMCWFYDLEVKDKGKQLVVDLMAVLDMYDQNSTMDIAYYDEKLFLTWERIEPCDQEKKKIWCAMIALERLNDGEVKGKVEWVNDVLTVSSSYTFLRCVVELV